MENRDILLKKDALDIISYAIKKADPYISTVKTLEGLKDRLPKSVTVFSIGKAAVPMANAAQSVLGGRIKNGLVVTKYGHKKGFSSEYFETVEAAHPVSDENSALAAEKAISIAKSLKEGDALLVLLSGGGSALFEKSVLNEETQRDITKKLLSRGADIYEINAIRRRISLVKGGGLAAFAYPSKVYTVALSDVLGNDKSTIASGITFKSPDDGREIIGIVKKYLPEYLELFSGGLKDKADMKINDGGYFFAGDITSLVLSAKKRAEELGYTVEKVNMSLTGEAKDEALRLIKETPRNFEKRAYIYGGETVVTLNGVGKGGRNQEMALSAAINLKGESGIVFASVGSDGTDGPTDAAGGIVCGDTFFEMQKNGVDPEEELKNNNSYFALKSAGALVVTGPTGTNVNDITLILTNYGAKRV